MSPAAPEEEEEAACVVCLAAESEEEAACVVCLAAESDTRFGLARCDICKQHVCLTCVVRNRMHRRCPSCRRMTLPSLLPQVRREIEAAAAEEGPAPPPAQEDLDRLAARNERFLQEKTSAPAHFARKQGRSCTAAHHCRRSLSVQL